MSAYLELFLRKGDTFCPIGSYSRSNRMYEIFSNYGVPYEHIRALTELDLKKLIEDERNAIEGMKDNYSRVERKKDLIINFNNPVEEKIEILDEIEEDLIDIHNLLSESERTLWFLYFLSDIIDEVKYSEYSDINVNSYLYAGIECFKPSVDDIEE